MIINLLEDERTPYYGLTKTVTVPHFCFGKKECPWCKINRGEMTYYEYSNSDIYNSQRRPFSD